MEASTLETTLPQKPISFSLLNTAIFSFLLSIKMGVLCSKIGFCWRPSNLDSNIPHSADLYECEENDRMKLVAFNEYSSDELKIAISEFSVDNIVSEQGENALNAVYKGQLEGYGSWIVVKRFNLPSAWPDPRPFLVPQPVLSTGHSVICLEDLLSHLSTM